MVLFEIIICLIADASVYHDSVCFCCLLFLPCTFRNYCVPVFQTAIHKVTTTTTTSSCVAVLGDVPGTGTRTVLAGTGSVLVQYDTWMWADCLSWREIIQNSTWQ